MNNYRVQWVLHARTLLAAAWLAVSDRNAVTRAQHAIDLALANNPTTAGRELSEGLWRIEVSPLVVFYEIDATSSTVTVTNLGFIP